jgi:CRISPR-associated protein Csm4
MKAFILRCKPGSQFHFGKMAIDSNSALHDTTEYFHSDTLFSALINIVASFATEAETNEVVDLFRDNQVRISSGMFCLSHGEQDVFFLPRPAHFSLLPGHADDIKDVERIKFISKGLWESGISPANMNDWHQEIESSHELKKFAAMKKEVQHWNLDKKHVNIHSIETFPKVHARKLDQENSFYFQSNVLLPQNPADTFDMHYYFLLDTTLDRKENEALNRLYNAIYLLPDTGIGGERSAGCGQFLSVEERPFEFNDFEQQGYLSLGLIAPANHAEIDELEYYNTVLRGGRNTRSDGELKLIRMMSEGAYLRNIIHGDMPNVHATNDPDTPYLRYGKPLLIPAHSASLPKMI